MLHVDIIKDDELQTTVKKFISGMLPHRNYDPKSFNTILSILLQYIKLDEFSMEYYVLIKALNEMNRISLCLASFEPCMSRSSFEGIVGASLSDSITSPVLRVEDWLVFEGLQNNLSIETVKQNAIQKVYERAMELYDECFALEISSNTVPNYTTELKAVFIAHISMRCVKLQVEILQGSYRDGRKIFSGSSDWLKYTIEATAELNQRLEEADNLEDENVITLDSVEIANKLLYQMKESFEEIAKYGIPELDDFTPILRHRLVVVVGMENVGKTKFLVDNAVNVLLSGGKVAYMCGETSQGKVLSQILINYINKKFNAFVQPQHIIDSSECPDRIQKCINIAMAELIESGQLTLIDTISYDDAYSQLVSIYEKITFDALYIDHSAALKGGARLENPIVNLSRDARAFKRNYPVFVMIASHPSAASKPLLMAGKPVVISPTRGSSVLGEEADETFILRDSDTLRRQNLVEMEIFKRRDAPKPGNIMLTRAFNVSRFLYDEAMQSDSNKLSSSAVEVLNNMNALYNESEVEEEFTLV